MQVGGAELLAEECGGGRAGPGRAGAGDRRGGGHLRPGEDLLRPEGVRPGGVLHHGLHHPEDQVPAPVLALPVRGEEEDRRHDGRAAGPAEERDPQVPLRRPADGPPGVEAGRLRAVPLRRDAEEAAAHQRGDGRPGGVHTKGAHALGRVAGAGRADHGQGEAGQPAPAQSLDEVFLHGAHVLGAAAHRRGPGVVLPAAIHGLSEERLCLGSDRNCGALQKRRVGRLC